MSRTNSLFRAYTCSHSSPVPRSVSGVAAASQASVALTSLAAQASVQAQVSQASVALTSLAAQASFAAQISQASVSQLAASQVAAQFS